MPTTRTIQVYQFAELDDSAKDKARDWFRSCMDSSDWNADEYVASLKRFCSRIGINLRDWSLGEQSNIQWEFDPIDHYGWDQFDQTGEHMRGYRLWKWFQNGNFIFSADEIREAVKGSCPLTGVCTDCPLFDALGRFLDRPDKYTTMHDLINEAMEDFRIVIENEVEYHYSDESVDESILANEYEFDEQGNRI